MEWRAAAPPKRYAILHRALHVLSPSHPQLLDERTQQGIDRSLPDSYDYETNKRTMKKLNETQKDTGLWMINPAHKEFAARLHAASSSASSARTAPTEKELVDFVADLLRTEAVGAQEYLTKKAEEKRKQKQSKAAGNTGAAGAADDGDDGDGRKNVGGEGDHGDGDDNNDEEEEENDKKKGGRSGGGVGAIGSASRTPAGELRCACCGVVGDLRKTLSACPCREVLYCSSNCQKLDWKDHKLSCKARDGGRQKKKEEAASR